MKKLILILSAFVVVFSSCHKDLNQQPLDTTTTETFFETPNDFLMALNGVYAVALRGSTLGNSYGYPDRLMNLGETRSDNLYAITDGARDWEGINGFQSSISANRYVGEAWTNNYAAITRANLLLEKLKESAGPILNDDSLVVQYEAQARFLRAFCYFDLVRWYGKVPIIDKTLTATEGVNYPRKPVAEVYDFIIADLEFAQEHLPESYSTATSDKALAGPNVGRTTKYAAKGYLAQVYMAMSSPTYGIEGPGLGVNQWSKAYALLNEIEQSGWYSMVTPYADIFMKENNKEVVFDVQYMSGADGVGASFVWILTPDGYFQSIGLSAQGSNYQRPVANSFRSLFAASDKRLAASILDSFVTGSPPVTYTYPFYKKYVDKTRYGSGRTNWGVNYVALRFTDVLMLKAECVLRGGGGSQTEVDEIVQSVRQRAGDSAVVSGINLDQLFAERRKEFCAEGTRWFDLQRSGKLVELMNAFRAADDATNNRILPVTNNAVIYPVPQSQILVAPGLYTQNPGYD